MAKNRWEVTMWTRKMIAEDMLQDYLNELENKPSTLMTYAEKIVYVGEGLVLVVVCVETKEPA